MLRCAELAYSTVPGGLNLVSNWSGMKATAELPSRAEKAEPDIMFSCICSNEFIILISINLILPYI